MLPAAQRLRTAEDFSATIRQGRRRGNEILSVYRRTRSGAVSVRAGLVVSKQIGNSVVRHRVSRRLREQLRPRLARLAPGTDLVVRAHPAAATASSAQLGDALDRALQPDRAGRRHEVGTR